MIRRQEAGAAPAASPPHASTTTATLLPYGKVLVAGAGTIGNELSGAELYDPGLGFDPAWQPLLTTVSPSILPDGSALTASGSRFKGISEASGGNGFQNSSSNYPLVQLLSLTNEQTLFLPVDAMAGWSDTSFTSTASYPNDRQFERLSRWLCARHCLHQRYPQSVTICARGT